MSKINRNPTRRVEIGGLTIGAGSPIAVQSMAATKTQDVPATTRQIDLLEQAGADLIRVAVDSVKDTDALARISETTSTPLSVDLQENYRLASRIAPHVQKIRYNPGHLYHHEKDRPVEDKVAFIAEQAWDQIAHCVSGSTAVPLTPRKRACSTLKTRSAPCSHQLSNTARSWTVSASTDTAFP